VLLEKYVAAAEKIMDAVIFTDLTPRRKTTRIESSKMEAKGGYAGGGLRVLSGKGELATSFTATKAGEYIFQIMSSTRQIGTETARMNISLDGRIIKTAPVTGSSDAGAIVEARTIVQPGPHRLLLTLANPYTAPPDSKGRKRDRGYAVDYVDVLAPGDPPELTEMQKKIFAPGSGIADKEQRALAIIKTFGARAFRRPVSDEEMSRYLKFVTMAEKEKETFEKGIKLACQAMLVSPNFLFRGEIQPEPNNPKSVHPINDYALASRLSYFLWSSMPDDELFREAGAQTLRKNLDAQVRRMLKDPRRSRSWKISPASGCRSATSPSRSRTPARSPRSMKSSAPRWSRRPRPTSSTSCARTGTSSSSSTPTTPSSTSASRNTTASPA
jgi:hypothetical protein